MKRNQHCKSLKNKLFIAGFIIAVAAAGGTLLYSRKLWLPYCFYNADTFKTEISTAAKKYGLPVNLVKALIRQESKFYPRAIGKDGEIGLMQIHPAGAAAEWARINRCPVPSPAQLMDVNVNLDIGCWYLARAINKWKQYRHGTELALAQYNAGAANAAKWKPSAKDGEVIPLITWPGTRQYVINIMKNYRKE